jgi:peptide/nickel transport system permease protein
MKGQDTPIGVSCPIKDIHMLRFLLRRSLGSIAVLLVVTFMSYTLIFLAPGDPATILIGKQTGQFPNPEQIAHFRAEYGLDHPFLVQYFNWIKQAVQGDLGVSIRTGVQIVPEVRARFANTLLLVSVTMFVAIIIGIPSGLLAAWFKNSFLDRLIHALSMLAVAIPDFWLAFLLILLFSIDLRWLPSHGMGSLKHLILPVICLGLANIARLNRLTRSGLLGVEREKYLLSARAKGLARRTAWIRHGFPNVAVPIVTLIFTLFSGSIAGTIIIENVFAWPGIGSYFVEAVSYRDLPVIQAMVALYGAVFILGNILADIAYVIIDPRIRLD